VRTKRPKGFLAGSEEFLGKDPILAGVVLLEGWYLSGHGEPFFDPKASGNNPYLGFKLGPFKKGVALFPEPGKRRITGDPFGNWGRI